VLDSSEGNLSTIFFAHPPCEVARFCLASQMKAGLQGW
jgi:hypothetical protein